MARRRVNMGLWSAVFLFLLGLQLVSSASATETKSSPQVNISNSHLLSASGSLSAHGKQLHGNGNFGLPLEQTHLYNKKGVHAGSQNLGSQERTGFDVFNVKQSNNTSDAECRDVKHQNDSAKCDFVQSTDDCNIDEGFIDYTESVYCTFGPKLLPLAIFVLVLWWLFLFIALAVAADKFFCPSLVVIARTLRMSDNIAGVTLLAFGNGAPDVFSAIAAVGTMKKGDAGLAVGALVGAGLFVTTVVAGSVAVVKPFHAMERPFLRDIIFYLTAVFMTFYVLYNKVISLVEAVAFIIIYFGYVIVVIIGRSIYQTRKRRRQAQALMNGEEDSDEDAEDMDIHPSLTHSEINTQPKGEHTHNADQAETPGELTPLLSSPHGNAPQQSAGRAFLTAISPIDIAEWSNEKWYGKVYAVFKVPAEFILLVTVPIVDFSTDNHSWNRHLNSLHCITAPLTALFCASHSTALTMLGRVFPVWALVVIIGAILAVIVYFTSTNDTPPVYHRVFAFVGFLTAVLWIDAIANEIVNLLQTFGIIFSISNAILGLTFLAWGNSLGDLVADTTMARQGQPKIGISACFGGPMFNLLMGIGIPFTIKTIKDGNVELDFTVIQVLLLVALAGSLISSLIILPIIRFNLNRHYGIYLYCFYAVFLLLAILVETNVIQGHL